MTHVFINKKKPHRIKMIEAQNMENALKKLEARLVLDINSGEASDYKFGYFI